MKLSQAFFAFLMGFFLYSMVEIISRGYTHWTMALTGGTVLAILYTLNRSSGITLMRSCFIGALIITAVEFAVGVVVNIILGWHVWDYSEVPLNILGQICLPYTGAWFLLCIPAYYLCTAIRRRFESSEVNYTTQS